MTDAIMSTVLNTLLLKEIILEKSLETSRSCDVSLSYTVFMYNYIIRFMLTCVKQYLKFHIFTLKNYI